MQTTVEFSCTVLSGNVDRVPFVCLVRKYRVRLDIRFGNYRVCLGVRFGNIEHVWIFGSEMWSVFGCSVRKYRVLLLRRKSAFGCSVRK